MSSAPIHAIADEVRPASERAGKQLHERGVAHVVMLTGDDDLADEIDALLRYPQTQGEVDDERLPEYEEFQELAADYEVLIAQ